MSDRNTESNRPETQIPSARLLEELKHRIDFLEAKAKELGEIHATLVVNFMQRETFGVQLVDDCDRTTQQLLMEIFRKLEQMK